jgi:hypothetical protein
MSKQVGAHIKCPSCGTETEFFLYRSLWIEAPENRKMVFEDRVNLFVCPSCGRSEQTKFPFLCTNTKLGFAVWYEPYHDEAIDRDIEDYKKNIGPNSFYATAPRVQDWQEFKNKIVEFEMSCPSINVPGAGGAVLGSFSSGKIDEDDPSMATPTEKSRSFLARKRDFLARRRVLEQSSHASSSSGPSSGLESGADEQHPLLTERKHESGVAVSADEDTGEFNINVTFLEASDNLNSDAVVAGEFGMFFDISQRMAALESASQRLIDAWGVIKDWLNEAGDQVGRSDRVRFARALKAYYALGVAPSKKLQSAFDEFSRRFKSEGYDYRLDLPPPKVLQAFSRLLATNEEMEKELIQESEPVRQPSAVEKIEKKKPLRRTLLSVWAALSIAWGGYVLAFSWPDLTPLYQDVSIVSIETELTEKDFLTDSDIDEIIGPSWRGKSHSGKTEKVAQPERIWLSVIKLGPGETELDKARKHFPSFNGKADAEFGMHLWRLVSTEAAAKNVSRKSTAMAKLWEVALFVTIPQVGVLLLGALIFWTVGRYPPSQLSPYAKKAIACAFIWIMVVGTWAWFFGEDFFYEDDHMVQFIFFPPAVIIVAAMLWRWAAGTSAARED